MRKTREVLWDDINVTFKLQWEIDASTVFEKYLKYVLFYNITCEATNYFSKEKKIVFFAKN